MVPSEPVPAVPVAGAVTATQAANRAALAVRRPAQRPALGLAVPLNPRPNRCGSAKDGRAGAPVVIMARRLKDVVKGVPGAPRRPTFGPCQDRVAKGSLQPHLMVVGVAAGTLADAGQRPDLADGT